MTDIAIVGLGYVGLPLAAEFGKEIRTIGFDINVARVKALNEHVDITGEVSSDELKAAKMFSATTDATVLGEAEVIVVCVPTPVSASKKPDFSPLISASETVGRNMKKGAIVVYESTVHPGATEEVCIPVLEKTSGLKWKKDFFVGYSPERINPGDKVHTLTTVPKIVAGDTPDTLKKLSKLYGSIVKAGIHEAESIAVAEAAKIMENTQRDLNIAVINECAMIFHKLGIDTTAVLEAAGTKWNFLPFRPGLVGGHCIGVDPYYLTEKAELLGHYPRVILAGRAINDGMGKYIAEQTIKMMIREGHAINKANVAVLGLTFKENVADLRNSRVIDVIDELKQFGVNCFIHDPKADAAEAQHEYQVELTSWERIPQCTAVIVAVPHDEYKSMGVAGVTQKLVKGGCLIDVKSLFPVAEIKASTVPYWRL